MEQPPDASVTGYHYPLRYWVDYPDRSVNRLTTFFRILVAIPILIVLGSIGGAQWNTFSNPKGGAFYFTFTSAALFVAPLLLIVFRQKYPRWWFDWNLELTRLTARVFAYLMLLRDEYPSTDEEQAVHLEIDYPDVRRDLNRWLPLVKWLLAIPHYFVLFILTIGAFFCVVIAWFAILITGRYPKGLFDFVVGYERWSFRVTAYAFLLVTDDYPPFDLL